MNVKIGMLIWKEMKNQGYSQSNFLEILRNRNVFLRELFKMDTIDTYSLIQVSILLKVNFFQFYEAEELDVLLKTDQTEISKISFLKLMIREQEKLLVTHKKMIRQQEHLIAHLKENYTD